MQSSTKVVIRLEFEFSKSVVVRELQRVSWLPFLIKCLTTALPVLLMLSQCGAA